MLLTITYTGKQTQNLGYLLHKNPYRAQSFDSIRLIWHEENLGQETEDCLTMSMTVRMFPHLL